MAERGGSRPLEEMHDKQRHAFKRYLNMGHGRSLRRLHVLLVAELGDEAPGERTLMGWSATFGWRDAAREHDRDLAVVDLAETRERHRDLRELKHRYSQIIQRTFVDGFAQKNPEDFSTAQLRVLLKDALALEEESIPRPRTVDLTPDVEDMAETLGMDPEEARTVADEALRDYQAAKDQFREEFGADPDD